MNAIRTERPTWVEISLSALRSNFKKLRQRLDPAVSLMAVVKANAYGHGAVECSRALEAEGADWFGVALVEEGRVLREAGIKRPVFCLGGFSPGQARDVIEFNLTPAVFRWDLAEELNSAAEAAGRIADIHIKVDSGMGRLGVALTDMAEFASAIVKLRNLRVDGLLSHFSDADSTSEEPTNEQLARFEEARQALHSLGVDPKWVHVANSAAVHSYPRSWGTLARPGACIYGLERDVIAETAPRLGLKPVLSLHSRILYLKKVPSGTPLGYGRTFRTERESMVATIPIGYADGLRRAHSNRGSVIVRGTRAPIVGRVSMDLTLVDVTDVAGVSPGDEVVLIGASSGHEIRAEDLAEQADTISYEIVCGISGRVPRKFMSE